MARPQVFSTDTYLYNVATGEKRLFPQGETDPGNAWSEKKGGDTAGAGTTAQAMKDLIAAQDQIEALQANLATQDASMAQLSGERDDAVGRVAGLEQDAIAAAKERDEALRSASDYMAERDHARSEAATRTKERDEAKAYAAELEAELAKFDAADSKPSGGSKSKSDPK
ncbi:hypothetical protein [Phenylobacterium sp.]|uniref:hypothetical protein n=1 Tax=Phenylobacterium sp. TaxID=1871053 RepID=UPI002FC74300